MISAIRERLEEYRGDGKKAFTENNPLYKPSKSNKNSPLIHSIKLKKLRKSGLLVRKGVADNGNIIRVDIFTKANKFYAVPLYVSDVGRNHLPNRAANANKLESEWPIMNESFIFIFSLFPNDWVRIQYKTGVVKEGYYCEFNRSTASISLYLHDRNKKLAKDGKNSSIGIKTVLLIEKYHVDLLGRLHKAKPETRQPLRHKEILKKLCQVKEYELA